MKLDDWRKQEGMSYEDLARKLDLTNSKTYRLCTDRSLCIKLRDANVIVKITQGEVGYLDFDLEGDC